MTDDFLVELAQRRVDLEALAKIEQTYTLQFTVKSSNQDMPNRDDFAEIVTDYLCEDFGVWSPDGCWYINEVKVVPNGRQS